MTSADAREIRATISEILDPLHDSRLGTLARHLAIEMAVGRLQRLDETLRGVELGLTAREAVRP